MKTAIINSGDTGAVEATAYMLSKVGYESFLVGNKLRAELRSIGVNSDDPEELAKRFAYDRPRLGYIDFVPDGALFLDLKAHFTYETLIGHWPKMRVLWLCINGGDPLKRRDGLRWANPPCPVLTHNQWYGCEDFEALQSHKSERKGCGVLKTPWYGKAYTCYPPYQRMERHSRTGFHGMPVCLVHNVERWGYPEAVKALEGLVRFYGGNSPDGLISNDMSCALLKTAKVMVLVKCGDAVGFSTVEAMASACPIVCTQHYIDETKLHALLEPGITCLTFDQKYPVESVKAALAVLSSKAHNEYIGQSGRERLLSLIWDEQRDLASWKHFMELHFPC